MMLKLSIVGLAIARMGSRLWKDWERCEERVGQEHIIYLCVRCYTMGTNFF